MTEQEIMSFPIGTKVRIVTTFKHIYKGFKKGGTLTFQNKSDMIYNEYVFGISAGGRACFII